MGSFILGRVGWVRLLCPWGRALRTQICSPTASEGNNLLFPSCVEFSFCFHFEAGPWPVSKCVVSFLARGFLGFVVHSSPHFVGDFDLKSLGSGSHAAQGALMGMALAPPVH